MCLIVFAFKQHPDYPLIVAANRDEYYLRPTANAHFWQDHPHIFAGRDLQAMGTWLGVNLQGQFAALTNIRETTSSLNGGIIDKPPQSRGDLCRNYLTQQQLPSQSKAELQDQFAGFNFIAGNIDGIQHFSNRQHSAQTLQPGVYGLSNGFLNTPWPKVTASRKILKHLIEAQTINHDKLIEAMQSTSQAPDNRLPETGIGVEWERKLSSRFIQTEHYGTRCSTSLLFNQHGEISFVEQGYDSLGRPSHRVEKLLQTTAISNT